MPSCALMRVCMLICVKFMDTPVGFCMVALFMHEQVVAFLFVYNMHARLCAFCCFGSIVFIHHPKGDKSLIDPKSIQQNLSFVEFNTLW